MPVRKMRVEVFDEHGNRYKITFEGHVTREKALRLLDLVELLGGMPGINPKWTGRPSELSKYDRVRLIIDKHFPIVWFSSRDIQSMYEQEFKKPIGLSTVSTYLSRMADRGFLMKAGNRSHRSYRIATKKMKRMVSSIKL